MPTAPAAGQNPDDFAGWAEQFKDKGGVGGMSSSLTTELVKGIGFARGKNHPEEDYSVLAPAVFKADASLRAATKRGIAAVNDGSNDVVKGLSPDFQQLLSRFMGMGPISAGLQQMSAQISQVLSDFTGKDITLTTPLSTGIVPFDLVAPSRLIYPVYTPLRNKLPRTPGQGTSRRAKLFTGISGSGTGSGSTGNATDISIAEIPAAQSMGANWPLSLPGTAAHSAIDLNIPYKFFGLTEPISWLSQFAGQGFEDISALANLLLMQKFMLNEEYMLLFGNTTALGNVTISGVTRAAAGAETNLSGVTTNVFVAVTAANAYGESAYNAGTVATFAVTTGVIDLTITPVAGADRYNVYLATGAANPGRTGFFPFVRGQGGVKLTIGGALPTTGVNPPAADSGTSAATRYDGLVSILTGNASAQYPVGASYNTQNVGTKLSVNAINAAFRRMWQVTKADPAEIVAEGSDIARLSDDIRTSASQNYRLLIGQGDMASILAGAAVSEFVNPVTRKMVPILVHPWLNQGTAMVMSYTMPFPWTNVPNIWEVVNVQDYLSIAWPVIDISFRYSIFMFGALVSYAPIYCGILQGLQIQDQNGAALATSTGYA